jgi:hypothetical protein
MTPTLETAPSNVTSPTDLATALQQVMAASTEPLTPSKARAALPVALRPGTPEELAEVLERQVAANVLYSFPKYRSQQNRYWDRPMPVHVAALIHETLAEKPMAFAELRRKLPAYAQTQAQTVLDEEVAKGKVHRHPKLPGSRVGELFGVRPADPRDYLRLDLTTVFNKLETLGFTQSQLRASALELLHDEEWATPPAASAQPTTEPVPEDKSGEEGLPYTDLSP